jgi:hypothetical protein
MDFNLIGKKSKNNVMMIDHSEVSAHSIRLPSTLDSQRAKSGLSQHMRSGSRVTTKMINYKNNAKRNRYNNDYTPDSHFEESSSEGEEEDLQILNTAVIPGPFKKLRLPPVARDRFPHLNSPELS